MDNHDPDSETEAAEEPLDDCEGMDDLSPLDRCYLKGIKAEYVSAEYDKTQLPAPMPTGQKTCQVGQDGYPKIPTRPDFKCGRRLTRGIPTNICLEHDALIRGEDAYSTPDHLQPEFEQFFSIHAWKPDGALAQGTFKAMTDKIMSLFHSSIRETCKKEDRMVYKACCKYLTRLGKGPFYSWEEARARLQNKSVEDIVRGDKAAEQDGDYEDAEEEGSGPEADETNGPEAEQVSPPYSPEDDQVNTTYEGVTIEIPSDEDEPVREINTTIAHTGTRTMPRTNVVEREFSYAAGLHLAANNDPNPLYAGTSVPRALAQQEANHHGEQPRATRPRAQRATSDVNHERWGELTPDQSSSSRDTNDGNVRSNPLPTFGSAFNDLHSPDIPPLSGSFSQPMVEEPAQSQLPAAAWNAIENLRGQPGVPAMVSSAEIRRRFNQFMSAGGLSPGWSTTETPSLTAQAWGSNHRPNQEAQPSIDLTEEAVRNQPQPQLVSRPRAVDSNAVTGRRRTNSFNDVNGPELPATNRRRTNSFSNTGVPEQSAFRRRRTDPIDDADASELAAPKRRRIGSTNETGEPELPNNVTEAEYSARAPIRTESFIKPSRGMGRASLRSGAVRKAGSKTLQKKEAGRGRGGRAKRGGGATASRSGKIKAAKGLKAQIKQLDMDIVESLQTTAKPAETVVEAPTRAAGPEIPRTRKTRDKSSFTKEETVRASTSKVSEPVFNLPASKKAVTGTELEEEFIRLSHGPRSLKDLITSKTRSSGAKPHVGLNNSDEMEYRLPLKTAIIDLYQEAAIRSCYEDSDPTAPVVAVPMPGRYYSRTDPVAAVAAADPEIERGVHTREPTRSQSQIQLETLLIGAVHVLSRQMWFNEAIGGHASSLLNRLNEAKDGRLIPAGLCSKYVRVLRDTGLLVDEQKNQTYTLMQMATSAVAHLQAERRREFLRTLTFAPKIELRHAVLAEPVGQDELIPQPLVRRIWEDIINQQSEKAAAQKTPAVTKNTTKTAKKEEAESFDDMFDFYD